MSAPDISDGTADQQIASHVDRLGFEWDRDMSARDRLWAHLGSTEACIQYVVDRVHPFLAPKTKRLVTLLWHAGNLMGCSGQRAGEIVRLVKRKGGVAGAQAWLAEPPSMPPLVTTGLTMEQIGFVYTAQLRNYPHVRKIGFSGNPERRMKELELKFGQPFELIGVAVGTPLDEAHAHCAARGRYIRQEFVFAPDFDDVRPGRIPAFLLDRHFKHLAED